MGIFRWIIIVFVFIMIFVFRKVDRYERDYREVYIVRCFSE